MVYSELYHHGIKGQKWGIRRYQNEDGTLTAAGRQRLNTIHSKSLDRSKKRAENAERYSKDYKKRLNEVKRNGTYSKEVRDKWDEMDEEEKWELAKRGGYVDSLDQEWDVMFKTVSHQNKVALEQLRKETIDELKSNYDHEIKTAEKYTKRYETLKTMDIEKLADTYGFRGAKQKIRNAVDQEDDY